MQMSTQYRELAALCERLANHPETARYQSILKEMAEAWNELAEDANANGND